MSGRARATRVAACVAIVALALAAGARAQVPDDSALHRVHDAVFDAWVPLDAVALDGSTRAEGRALRDTLWQRFSRSSEMRVLLSTVRALRCGEGPAFTFDSCPLRARESLLVGMLRSPNAEQRRAGMQLRLAYLTAAYDSPFGRRVAGLADVRPTPQPSGPAAVAPVLPKSWLAYDADKHRLVPRDGRIDYLIVGSGPAGCVLAHELRAAGRRVLVLEQGSFVVPGAMDTRGKSPLLESGGRRASTSGSVLFNNAETVGGGSTVNIDLVFSPESPSIQKRIAGWRKSGAIAPGQYDLASLRAADAWVKARLGTRTPDASEINRNNRTLWDGATRAGLHPKLYELNTYLPGAWATPATDKRSAVSGLLIEALTAETNPLALVPDAHVEQVLTEPGATPGSKTAIGVEFTAREQWANDNVIADPMKLGIKPGERVTVRASRVILCAGSLGSAAILLRTDIDDPDVGRGVVAHPAVPVIGRFDDDVDAFRGTPATVFVDDHAMTRGFMLESMSAGPEYAAIMTPGTGRKILDTVKHYRQLAGFGVMLIDESSRENCVFMGPGGNPGIRYELTATDRARLADGVETAVRLMFLAGAREVFVPSYEETRGPVVADGWVFTDSSQVVGLRTRLKFVANSTLVTSAHLQSSDKMGTQPDGSVVSPHHDVWTVKNLYVADSSVFPTSVGANPMQSIYVFAKLFADELLHPSASKSPATPPKRPPAPPGGTKR